MKELLPWGFWLIGIICLAKAIDLWKANEYDAGFNAGVHIHSADHIVGSAHGMEVYGKPERQD